MVNLGKIVLLNPPKQSQTSAAIEPRNPLRTSVAGQIDGQWQQAIQVSLSPEAKAKLENEGDIDFGQAQSKNQAAAATGKNEDSSEGLIKQLKEKIRELAQRIASLSSKQDEASQNKAELLRADLASLYAQLINLVNEKLTKVTVAPG